MTYKGLRKEIAEDENLKKIKWAFEDTFLSDELDCPVLGVEDFVEDENQELDIEAEGDRSGILKKFLEFYETQKKIIGTPEFLKGYWNV